MRSCFLSSQNLFALSVLIAAAGCSTAPSSGDAAFTPVGECKVYEGAGETTEYAVQLGIGPNSEILLGVQGFHPGETEPQRIVAILLSNGRRLKPEQLANNCTCGVTFRRSDSMCAFITTYQAVLERDWLEDARATGLSMRFELENDLTVDGPVLQSQDIERFLERLN